MKNKTSASDSADLEGDGNVLYFYVGGSRSDGDIAIVTCGSKEPISGRIAMRVGDCVKIGTLFGEKGHLYVKMDNSNLRVIFDEKDYIGAFHGYCTRKEIPQKKSEGI